MTEKQPKNQTDFFNDSDQLFYYASVSSLIERNLMQDITPDTRNNLFAMATQLISMHIITPEQFIDISYIYVYSRTTNLPMEVSNNINMIIPEHSTV